MSTKPDNAVKVATCLERAERDPFALRRKGRGLPATGDVYRSGLGALKDGFAYRPTPSFPPGPRFGGGLRAVGRAGVEPDGDQRQILPVRPRGPALDGHSGRSRPAPARTGAPVL